MKIILQIGLAIILLLTTACTTTIDDGISVNIDSCEPTIQTESESNSQPAPQAENKEKISPEMLITNFLANYLLTEEGDVYSWGRNEFGELGLGVPLDEFITQPTKIPELSDIKKIMVAPSSYMAGAINAEGELYVWGQNAFNLTTGNHDCKIETPQKVNFDGKITDASLSFSTICVIDEFGDVYTSGMDKTKGTFSFPTEDDYTDMSVTTFVKEDIPEKVVSVIAQAYGKTFLTTDGKVYASSYVGDLKKDENVRVDFPEKITKIQSSDNITIALGESGTLYGYGMDRYGLISDDFGANADERLGNGDIYDEPTVISKVNQSVLDFQLDTSNIISHCVDGNYYQWGYNASHNISNSDDSYIYIPQKLNIQNTVKEIHNGCFSNTVIYENGDVGVWGSNWSGLYLHDDYNLKNATIAKWEFYI